MRPADLQILFAARQRRELGTPDKRYSEYWAVHIVLDGNATVRQGDQTWDLKGDWLWTKFPGPRMAHAPSGKLPSSHWRIACSGTRLQEWLNDGLWPTEPQPIRDREPIIAAADRLLALLVGDDALGTRQRANALEGLLLEIARQQMAAPRLPTWVLDVQRRLLARWRDTPDYTAIATAHHMPEHRLRRDFRAAVGLPIHTWLLRQRHAEAQRLLLNSDDDLATIAEACGFEDQAFFSRQFRIHVGMSPSQWRRAAYG